MKQTINYKTQGVCSRQINLTVEDEVLSTIKTVGDIVDYIEKKG